MTWNYRIVRHADGSLALHEVYYDSEGTPSARSSEPTFFVVDEEEGSEGLIKSLEMALESVKKHGVLDDPWPE